MKCKTVKQEEELIVAAKNKREELPPHSSRQVISQL